MSDITKKDLEDIRLGNSKDIARIEALLKAKPNSDVVPAPSISASKDDDTVKKELEELATYRENERQGLLKKLPKQVIEEFKLHEASLTKVKEISTLTQVIRKRSVGIDTPPLTTATKEKKFQWNPETCKNEMC